METKMLRQTSGASRLDDIRNADIHDMVVHRSWQNYARAVLDDMII